MKTTSRQEFCKFFCYDYFEDLLVPITFTKNFGFLAGVVSKMFAIESTLQSKNHFLRNAFWKRLFIMSPFHNNRAQKLGSRNRKHILCEFSVFTKKCILQIFFQR